MRVFKKISYILLGILLAGFLIPQNLEMPVEGGSKHSYNPQSFWYYPWGKSVVHRGVDIFAKKGTPVKSSTYGWVLSATNLGRGGNFVVVLGPKWRIHYYAHLDKITTTPFSFVTKNTQIGTVGNSGNAASTPSHLHYSIATPIPYPWRIDGDHLGWLKMFYLNPIDYLEE